MLCKTIELKKFMPI